MGGNKIQQQTLEGPPDLAQQRTPHSLQAFQFLTQRIEGRRTKSSTRAFDRTPPLLLNPMSHKDINGLGGNCSRPLTRLHMYNITPPQGFTLKEARLPVGITLHVSTPAPNHTPHNPETVMPRERLYKWDIASPSRHTTIFTTLLRLFYQFHYLLYHHSANVLAGTFCSTAKDISPPYRKRLPIIRTFFTTIATQPFSPDRAYLFSVQI